MSENTDRNGSCEPDFRSIGFSDYARHFPRDAAGQALLAAFNNVRPDQLTEAMKFYPNEATKDAWERVASAAEQFFAVPQMREALAYVVDFCERNHMAMPTVSGDEAMAAMAEECAEVLALATSQRREPSA